MLKKYREKNQKNIKEIAKNKVNQYYNSPSYLNFKKIVSLYGYSDIQKVYKIIKSNKASSFTGDYICFEPNAFILIGIEYISSVKDGGCNIINGYNTIIPNKYIISTQNFHSTPILKFTFKDFNNQLYSIFIRPTFKKIFHNNLKPNNTSLAGCNINSNNNVQNNISIYNYNVSHLIKKYIDYVNNDNNNSFLRDISFDTNINLSFKNLIKSLFFYIGILLILLLVFYICCSKKAQNILKIYLLIGIGISIIIQLMKYFNHLRIPKYLVILIPIILYLIFVIIISFI